jgi:SAM-dependent methyltransferase
MKHPYWITPQSGQWHANLAKSTGEYKYPWKSEFDEPRAEVIFMEKIMSNLNDNARILDVGCGHGAFTSKLAGKAKEIVGIDIIEGYITSANQKYASDSVRFLVVDADQKFPFADDSFNVVYTKKGPWLFHKGVNEGHRIIKPGGIALGLYHCGTDGGLRSLFPGLYSPLSDNYLNELRYNFERQILESGLEKVELQIFEEVEYLSSPEDVLIKKCFGQSEELKEIVWRECLKDVEEIFHRNATPKGLEVINYHALLIGKSV